MGVSLENAEALVACHVLDFSSFSVVGLNDFNKAMHLWNCVTTKELKKAVLKEIGKYKTDINLAIKFMEKSYNRCKEELFYKVIKAETALDVIEAFFSYNTEIKKSKITTALLTYLSQKMKKKELEWMKKDQ